MSLELLSSHVDDTAWWRQAADFYREEAQHADDRVAAELLVEAGRILAEQLGLVVEAQAAFDAAEARAPQAVLPLLARADLAEAESDWLEAAECLRAALQRVEGEDRVPLLARLATLAERHLARPDEAYDLLREAVRFAPRDRDLLIRLELARPGVAADGADAARREVLERRLAVTTALSERGALLAELGLLLEQDDTHRAARAFADAVAANPDIEAAVHGLVRTHLELARYRPLVRVLSTHADRVREPGLRAEILTLCGVVRDARLDEPEGAISYFERALAVQSSPETTRALALACERCGRPADALRWLEAEQAAATSLRSQRIWRTGRAAALSGATPAQVTERLQAGLAADETSLPLRLALRRTAWQTRDVEALHTQIEALLGCVTSEEEAELLRLHQGDVALWWGGREQAKQAYGQALEHWQARGEIGGEVPEALRALRPLLLADQAWPTLASAVRAAFARLTDAQARDELRGWLADLEAGPLAQPAAAEATFLELALADPGNLAAVEALRRVAEIRPDELDPASAGPDQAALRQVLAAARGAAQSTTRRLELLIHLARLEDDAPTALARWREALALDPLALVPRMALGRALDAAGDQAGLVELCRSELAALPEGDARRLDVALRLARILSERLGDPVGAAEALSARFDEAAAREEREKLADRLGDAAARRHILETRVAAGGGRAEDWLELATLDPESARAHLEDALSRAPADGLVAWVVEGRALAAGDLERAVALYRVQAQQPLPGGLLRTAALKLAGLAPPEEASALLARLVGTDADAAWYMVGEAARRGDAEALVARLLQLAHLLGDEDAAQALLREAAERALAAGLPDRDQTLIWERLRSAAETPDQAHAALLEACRRQEDHDGQAILLTELARLIREPNQQASAFWLAGLALEKTAPAEAGALYLQAGQMDLDDPTPLLLGLRIGPDGGPLTGAERAARLEAIANRLCHDGRAAQLLATAARLREGDGDLELGAHDWLQAAFRAPEREPLARRAEVLLIEAGEVAALIALLERRVRRLADPAERLATLRRLATVHIELAGDRAAAVRTWETIVAAEPQDPTARLSLADLLVGLERYPEAVEHYRQAALRMEDRSERIALHTRAGELLARHLHDHEAAIDELRKAVGLFDPSGRALEVLAEVYLLAHQADLALLAYQRLERMGTSGPRQSLARAGQVRALIDAGRVAEARERVLRFLAIDGVEPMLAALAAELGVEVPAEALEAEPLVAAQEEAPAELEAVESELEAAPAPPPPAPDPVLTTSQMRALDRDALLSLQAALAAKRKAAEAPVQRAPEVVIDLPDAVEEAPELLIELPEEASEGPFEPAEIPQEADEGPFEPAQIPQEAFEGALQHAEEPEEASGGALQHAEEPEEADEGPFEHAEIPQEADEGPFEHAEIPQDASEGALQHAEEPEEAHEGPIEPAEIPQEADEGPFEPAEIPQEAFEAAPEHPEVSQTTLEAAPEHPEVSQATLEAAPEHPEVSQTTLEAAPEHPEVSQTTLEAAPEHPEVSQATLEAAPEQSAVSQEALEAAPEQSEVSQEASLDLPEAPALEEIPSDFAPLRLGAFARNPATPEQSAVSQEASLDLPEAPEAEIPSDFALRTLRVRLPSGETRASPPLPLGAFARNPATPAPEPAPENDLLAAMDALFDEEGPIVPVAASEPPESAEAPLPDLQSDLDAALDKLEVAPPEDDWLDFDDESEARSAAALASEDPDEFSDLVAETSILELDSDALEEEDSRPPVRPTPARAVPRPGPPPLPPAAPPRAVVPPMRLPSREEVITDLPFQPPAGRPEGLQEALRLAVEAAASAPPTRPSTPLTALAALMSRHEPGAEGSLRRLLDDDDDGPLDWPEPAVAAPPLAPSTPPKSAAPSDPPVAIAPSTPPAPVAADPAPVEPTPVEPAAAPPAQPAAFSLDEGLFDDLSLELPSGERPLDLEDETPLPPPPPEVVELFDDPLGFPELMDDATEGFAAQEGTERHAALSAPPDEGTAPPPRFPPPSDGPLTLDSLESDEPTGFDPSTAPPPRREEPFSTAPPERLRGFSSIEEGGTPDRPSRPLAALNLLRARTQNEPLTIPEARLRIQSSPIDLDAWRSLRERMADRPELARWLADVFAWLDGRVLTGQIVRPALTVPDDLRDALIPTEVPPALVALLRAVALPVRLALGEWRRATNPRPPLDPANPLNEVAERVATALGAASFRLALDEERPYSLSLEPGSLPVVVVGRSLVERATGGGLSFLIARGLAPLVEGTLPARLMGDRDFHPFLTGLLHVLGAELGDTSPSAGLERARAVLAPCLENVDPLVRVLAADTATDLRGADLRAVRRGLERYIDRLALVLADGFGGSLDMLRLLEFDDRPRADLDSDDVTRFLRDHPAAGDLIIFAASEPCLALRRWLLLESNDQ